MTTPSNNLQEAFENGLSFKEYLSGMQTLKRHMRQQYEALSLPADIVAPFAEQVRRHGEVRILVLTEDYCPDSVLNLSTIARLAEATPGVTLRIVYREDYRPLADRYPTADGYNHIPTVLLFTPDGTELGVWHERPAAAHAFLAEYEASHPQPPRTRPDGSPNPEHKTWFKDRLAVQKEAYRNGLWKETVGELTALLESAPATV